MKHLKLFGFLCSLLFSTALMAQDTVSGTIIDENGEAVIGASVLIKGTTKGTTTDIDGKFSLEAAGVDATLIISYIGYEKQEVFVGSRTTIDVTMQPDLEQLEEVVITALGFKEKKDKLGSTYSTVKTEDAVRSGESNVLNSLASKASNVQINATNGDPGAGTNIRIRGANTITGSPDPLYIIDGIPVSGGAVVSQSIGGNNISGGRDAGTSQSSRLNDLNPNDIESIQVLKGASAAALWGSRAANGVVVITTKNGKAGKPTISYKATYSIDKVQERIAMQNTYGQGDNGAYDPADTESWGDYIPDRAGGADDVISDGSAGYFEAPDGTRYYPLTNSTVKNSTDTYVDSNWDAVIGTGQFLQHDLSVSGGNDKATYFFSLGRLDQNGIVKNSEYERTNIRFNTDFTLADWITFKSKAGYTNSFTNRIQQSSNVTGLMLGLLRGPADFDNTHYQGTYYDASGVATENVQRSYRRHLGNGSAGYNNPLWTANNQGADSKLNRFVISNELNIVPTDWLQVILRNGVDYYTDNQTYTFAPGSASDRSVGVFADDDISNREINFDAIARGDFELNSNVNLQVTLGFNVNDKSYKIQSTTLRGYSAFLLGRTTSALNGDAASTTFQNERVVSRSNRGYGILNFDLFDQLNVSFSGANEAASTVKGSFFYPAVELGWRFSEQFDLNGVGITFAKLRATWGQVGIQPSAHQFQTLSETAFTYSTYNSDLAISQFGGGFRLSDALGDTDLVPEIKTEWEVGLDLKLFSDKIRYGITYYQNEIKDMLIDVELAPSLGYVTQYTNAATMENKGLEMDLDVTVLSNSDWNIGVYGNFGQNKNEVTSLKNTETVDLTGQSVSSRAIVGQPLGVLYGTGALRDDEGNLDLDDYGFPQLNPEPVILGDPNPDWKGGFGFRANWKGFALNALFEHSQGGEFSPRTLWVLRRFGTTQEVSNRITTTEDLHTYADSHPSSGLVTDVTITPSGTTIRGNVHDFGGGNVLLDESWYRSSGLGGGFGDSQLYDTGGIKDATFTRLRELSLSYTLNSEGFRNATKLSSVVFTATGRNLFLWDNIEGIDPQVNQTGTGNGIGLEYFTNPSTKSFVFSVGINF